MCICIFHTCAFHIYYFHCKKLMTITALKNFVLSPSAPFRQRNDSIEPAAHKAQFGRIYFRYNSFIMQKRNKHSHKRVITVFLPILQHDKDIRELKNKVSTMKSPLSHFLNSRKKAGLIWNSIVKHHAKCMQHSLRCTDMHSILILIQVFCSEVQRNQNNTFTFTKRGSYDWATFPYHRSDLIFCSTVPDGEVKLVAI